VLLIVAALSGPELQSLHTRARSLGLEVLVEVHDEHELELALEAGAELVGSTTGTSGTSRSIRAAPNV